MNLVEQLLKADIKKAEELESGVFHSRRLAKILETEEKTIDVTIREVASRRVNDIVSYQMTSNGELDFSKTYDAKLMMITEGTVDPDLRDKDLQKYFGCENARKLAEKLFSNEINELSDAISELSGISNKKEKDNKKNDEQEIKN